VAKKRVGKHPLDFRQMAMERMKDCSSVSALAEELGMFSGRRALGAEAGKCRMNLNVSAR
jgi:hypothetical protein